MCQEFHCSVAECIGIESISALLLHTRQRAVEYVFGLKCYLIDPSNNKQILLLEHPLRHKCAFVSQQMLGTHTQTHTQCSRNDSDGSTLLWCEIGLSNPAIKYTDAMKMMIMMTMNIFRATRTEKKCIERVLLIFILHNRSWFFIRELIVCGG